MVSTMEAVAQVPIQSSIFGQNAWYINVNPSASATTFEDGLEARLPEIAASGVKFMRIGGIGPNWAELGPFV